jgi:hypothetical protein
MLGQNIVFAVVVLDKPERLVGFFLLIHLQSYTEGFLVNYPHHH